MKLFKKYFIILGVLVFLGSFILPSSAGAETYVLNQVPCANLNLPGYIETGCDIEISLNNDDPLSPGEMLNMDFKMNLSGYGGMVGAPSQIFFGGPQGAYPNGYPGYTNSQCDNFCTKAWINSMTVPFTISAPLSNGCYSVPVFYKWTFDGSPVYQYTTNLPYRVGNVTCGGGGSSGGGSGSEVTVVAQADPTQVNSEQCSTINYFSSNAVSCYIENVDTGQIIGQNCPVVGAFNTGPLPSNISSDKLHTYRVTCGTGPSYMGSPIGSCAGSSNTCGGGNLSMNIIKPTPESYFTKIKNFINKITPKALADIVYPSAYVNVGILAKYVAVPPPPSPVVTLNKKPTQEKNVINKSDGSWKGTAYFDIIINNLPTGQSCVLKNTADSSYGVPFITQDISQFIDVKNLSAATNDFWLDCEGTNLDTIPANNRVRAQSGTLSTTSAECIIPVDGGTCNLSTTWNTVSPKDGVLSFFKVDNTTLTNPPANSGNGVNITLAGASYMSNGQTQKVVNLKLFNKIDGEHTIDPSVENQLANKDITIKCQAGSIWRGEFNQCKTSTFMSGTLSSQTNPCIIAAGGNSCTVNLNWSISNPEQGTTTLYRGSTFLPPSLNTPTTTVFHSGVRSNAVVIYPNGTFFLRNNNKSLVPNSPNGVGITVNAVCASGSSWNGSICQAYPDLIAINQSPWAAPVGSVELKAKIKNQGTASTGASFNNFFQISTVNPRLSGICNAARNTG